MRLPRLEIIAFVALGLGALHLTACSGPCRSLAEQICSCEPNRTSEEACLVQIDAAGDRELEPEEAEVCSALLDTCDCEALARQDFAACGLSKSPGG